MKFSRELESSICLESPEGVMTMVEGKVRRVSFRLLAKVAVSRWWFTPVAVSV